MTTEDDLRQVLAERAALGPDPARLLATVPAPPRSSRRLILAAAVMTTAIAGAAIPYVLSGGQTPAPLTSSAASAEPGWLPEGYSELHRSIDRTWNGTMRTWGMNGVYQDAPVIRVITVPARRQQKAAARQQQEASPRLPRQLTRETVAVRGITASLTKRNDGREQCHVAWRESGLEIEVAAFGQRDGACQTALHVADAIRTTGRAATVPQVLAPAWTPEHMAVTERFQRKIDGICSTGIRLDKTVTDLIPSTVTTATLSREETRFAKGGTPVDVPAGAARLYHGPRPQDFPKIVVDLNGRWTLTVDRMDNGPADMSALIQFTRNLKITHFPDCGF